MSSSWSELTDNSSDEVSSCGEMENVLIAGLMLTIFRMLVKLL